MLSSILAFGYLFVAGFVFVVMILQILAFYIAGRVTGSINDEISSAFTLFGALLVIGTAATLINAGVSPFLEGLLIPGIISSAVYLIAILFAVVKIYELSVGKAILYLILTSVIMAIVLGGIVYAGIRLLPGEPFTLDLHEITETDAEPGPGTISEPTPEPEPESVESEADNKMPMDETAIEETADGQPSMPPQENGEET